jgi:hypothetical protein
VGALGLPLGRQVGKDLAEVGDVSELKGTGPQGGAERRRAALSRAICPECEKRVPVVVRRNDSLAYRSHGSCAAAGRTVEPERVVGWGTFGHLASVSALGGMVSG